MHPGDLRFQREVTRALISILGDYDFALAGSSAIREHGLIDRPTRDIDLFTVMSQRNQFHKAVEQAIAYLRIQGYEVSMDNDHPFSDTFAKIIVSGNGQSVEVEAGIDWRRDDPVRINDIHSVLSQDDAVANKIDALYSRGEARDYLDALSIRESGHYTDEQLMALAEEHDIGFRRDGFIEALRFIDQIPDEPFLQYVGRDRLAQIRRGIHEWADVLSGG